MRRPRREMRRTDPLSTVASFVVYAGLVTFVAGMGYRVYQWLNTPKSEVKLALYPKPQTEGGLITKVLTDTLVAPQSREIEPGAWAASFAWHAAAFAAFVGHLRLLAEFKPLQWILGKEGLDEVGGAAGAVAGVVMTGSTVYHLGRRFKDPYKRISVPEDYLLLLLILAIELTGDHMRLRGDVHAEDYRGWFRRTLALRPAFPERLAKSQSRWSLDAHMISVGALLAYFPFSKLVHVIGAFFANAVRSE
jgi:nitrate reductase gamma subunit